MKEQVYSIFYTIIMSCFNSFSNYMSKRMDIRYYLGFGGFVIVPYIKDILLRKDDSAKEQLITLFENTLYQYPFRSFSIRQRRQIISECFKVADISNLKLVKKSLLRKDSNIDNMDELANRLYNIILKLKEMLINADSDGIENYINSNFKKY